MDNRENKASQRKKRVSTKRLVKTILKQAALEKIEFLLTRADHLLTTDPELSQRYVFQARKIQMRTRSRLPTYWKKRICRHCKSLLKPGVNCRVRLSSTNRVISIKCQICGEYNRFPYYKRNKR